MPPRWLLLVVLVCCALDLAVPLTATPAGIELEDEEEAVPVAQVHVARPLPAPAVPGDRPAERWAAHVRAATAVAPDRRHAGDQARPGVRLARAVGVPGAAARSPEDH